MGPINLTLYPVRIEISTLCPFVSARPCWVAEMASNKLWRSVSDQPFCNNQKTRQIPYSDKERNCETAILNFTPCFHHENFLLGQ